MVGRAGLPHHEAQPVSTLLEQRAAAAATKLAHARAGLVRGEMVELPVFGKAWMEIVGHRSSNAIEAEIFATFSKLGLGLDSKILGDKVHLLAGSYDNHRKALTLAEAVRDPADHEVRFGTPEQWCELDASIIDACAVVYEDVKWRLDPMSSPRLTQEVVNDLCDAFEKKNWIRLRQFGASMLIEWLLSSDGPQLKRRSQNFSTSELSAESSPEE